MPARLLIEHHDPMRRRAVPTDAGQQSTTNPMRRTASWSRTLLAVTTVAVVIEAVACAPTADDFEAALTGICDVKDPVASIRMQPSQLTLPVGGTAQLTATLIAPDGGTYLFCAPQTFWLSANAFVASVRDGGVLGVTPGTTYISARSGGKADSVKVTVTSAQ
jgi:Bacterial Ig-like domain (group 2)